MTEKRSAVHGQGEVALCEPVPRRAKLTFSAQICFLGWPQTADDKPSVSSVLSSRGPQTPDLSRSSAPHSSTPLLPNRDHTGARMCAGSVGPVANGFFDCAFGTWMLDAQEESFAVGCELAAADFCACRTAQESLQTPSFRSARRTYPAAVIRSVGLRAIRDDPKISV